MATLSPLTANLIALLVGAVVGGLAVAIWHRGRAIRLAERLRQREAQLVVLEDAAASAERLRIDIARLEAAREADTARLAWIHTADEQLRDSFRAVAGEALERNAHGLLERSDQRLQALTAPLARALETLEAEVRGLEVSRQGAYAGLKQEIVRLGEAHRALRGTAAGLEAALRAPTMRGRWGEVQLRRVVEMAGMVEHVDFEEQATVADGRRPDLLVRLPGDAVLPVDAKVPMQAFLEATDAVDESVREARLDAHLRAVKQRIVELGQRAYWRGLEQAPEFVVMFMPSEAALGAAFARDGDLLELALRQRVLPATPVTLVALLKTVAHGWQQHAVASNARRIAGLGQTLYDRLGQFVAHLERVGQGLDGAVAAYNRALGSLEHRVLPSARGLQEAGAARGELGEPSPIARTVRPPRSGSTPR